MSLEVTKQDRKRVKTTALIFCVLFVICAGLAIFFISRMPRATQIKALGENGEPITSLFEASDDKSYYVQSKNLICEFDAYTDELLSEFNLLEEIGKKTEGQKLVSNSLSQWSIQSVQGEANTYLLITDGNGNLFKLQENDEGKLEVCDDFYLLDSDENGTFVAKETKGFDNIGDDVYFLTIEKGFFYVSKFDLENLASGVLAKKTLWDLGTVSEDGYQQVEALKSSTGILGFYAHEEFLFLFKSGGGFIRLSTELVDSKRNGEGIDFFADAEKASVRDEEAEAVYLEIYNHTYRRHILEYVLERIETGKVAKTKEEAEAATTDELIVFLQDAGISGTTITKIKNEAKSKAVAAAEEATKTEFEWYKDYAPSLMSMQVKAEYIDKNYYSVLYPGENTIYGTIYSKANKAVYYTNASDGYLYVIDAEDIAAAEVGSFMSDISMRIESVKCKEGQTFSNFGNGLNYNKFANTLYLKFANEKTVAIVDINDIDNYRVIYAYEGDFDMFGMFGDAENNVTHVIHQVIKVGMDGKDNPSLYVCTYQPEIFEQKTLIKAMFVVFLVLAALTLIGTVFFALSLRNARSLKKVKFIVKDTKKNKWVYLSLLPFIAMLVMFCYYEAVGSIAMSFFDYTREKPSWIWNNFANYIKIFNQPDFLPSIGNMLFFLVSDLLLSIVPPIAFACLLILIRNQVVSNWIRSLMFIPGIIPSIATMLIWRVGIYGEEGILNQLITWSGGEAINWLLHEDFARWSLILMGFPFIGGYLIFYGGMVNIPQEYHEAARLEGLGTVKSFLIIDIPLIAPQIKYIFITTFISSVQNFGRTHILRSTVVTTPVQNMYEMMTVKGDYGMSSAYATLMFLFLLVAIVANFKLQKKEAMGDDL